MLQRRAAGDAPLRPSSHNRLIYKQYRPRRPPPGAAGSERTITIKTAVGDGLTGLWVTRRGRCLWSFMPLGAINGGARGELELAEVYGRAGRGCVASSRHAGHHRPARTGNVKAFLTLRKPLASGIRCRSATSHQRKLCY